MDWRGGGGPAVGPGAAVGGGRRWGDHVGGGVVGAVGPGVLPGYPELSLASVRARLRALGVDDLEALLVYEQANENRAEFVRMLTNRITTVRDQ